MNAGGGRRAFERAFRQAFEREFGCEPDAVSSAPGRVNLLGEHTDYNEGFVLPTTIPQRTSVAIARSRDGKYRLHSAQVDERVEYAIDETPPRSFASYIHGCLEGLRELGVIVPALCVHVDSDVPVGAGLSSSAALEVAVLRAVRELLDLDLDDIGIAYLAQQAEIRHVGVRCGIMDQMASSLGEPSRMLFLDTRSLERRLLPLPAQAQLVVLDSGVPRTLAGSGYNERREQCEAAARQLGVHALRDVVEPARAAELPSPLDRRARHVITENARVLAAIEGITADRFGELMNASHASLRDDYDVSTIELDALVAALQSQPDVYGARLTGAGFGGACVALVREGRGAEVSTKALEAYSSLGYRGLALV